MRNQPKLLIVDDLESERSLLKHTLEAEGYPVVACACAKDALQRISSTDPDVRFVLTDLQMPEMDGIELTAKIKEIDPAIEIVVMTAQGEIESAVRAIHAGASNYVIKPVKAAEIRVRLLKLQEKIKLEGQKAALESENRKLRGSGDLCAQSPVMRRLVSSLEKAIPTDATILLTGETGTGKEVLARFIHQNSARASGPLITVNCSAIPENLAESEFFGHEKGAFTGADRRVLGLFEKAQGGTLFLDEIGDMDLKLQPKLLRALEQRQIRRVAGTADIDVDVRVIAATHRDLREAVAAKSFREDLYFRINVVNVHLPPLRERREDLPDLVNALIARFSTPGKSSPPTVSGDFLTALSDYPFPGNIRELANIMERVLIHFGGVSQLRSEHLPAEIRPGKPAAAAQFPAPLGDQPLPDLMASYEKQVLQAKLKIHGTDMEALAKDLKISRSSLYAKLAKHGLKCPS